MWTPQVDDVVLYGEDEDDAVVWGDLREDMGEVEGHECPVCGADLDPGESCDCWRYDDLDDGDGEDGYASGGHMEYWHAQYDG